MAWLISRALMADYESSRCSRAPAAASLAAGCWDGAPSAPSNPNPTPQAYLPSDRTTAFSRPSRYGMTFGPLTADLGEALLTWFLAAFPARTSVWPAKGGGIDGERSGLWTHMARIIGEVRPRHVLVENSPVLTGRGLDRVLGDLAALGFDARWGVLGAADVGAPHKRDRIWIVVHPGGGWRPADELRPGREQPRACRAHMADAQGVAERPGLCPDEPTGQRRVRLGHGGGAGDLADTHGAGFPAGRRAGLHSAGEAGAVPTPSDATVADASSQGLPQPEREALPGTGRREEGRAAAQCRGWPAEPDVGRVAHGVAARVDRLKALGNGQVPRVAAAAWRILGPAK